MKIYIIGTSGSGKTTLAQVADLIVWLDYPFWRVFSRIFRRTLKNIITKTPIARGNQETFYQQFFTNKSIFLWIIQTHWKRQRNYSRMMEEGQYKDKWVKISNPQECEKFILRVERWLSTSII